MIKSSRKTPLLAALSLVVLISVSGCRNMFSGDAAGKTNLPPLPSKSTRAPASSLGSSRPPPLLLSKMGVSATTPALPVSVEKRTDSPAKALSAPISDVANGSLPEQSIVLPASTPPSGFFMPNFLLGNAAKARPASKESLPSIDSPMVVSKPKALSTPDVRVVPAERMVIGIYVSPTTRTYFAAGGMDYVQTIVQPWEDFLGQNDIRIVRILNPEALLTAKIDALVLPSAVALSATERTQLANFREQGGNILATWLSGVRNEQGQWLGFDFMERVLDTGVSGTTAEDDKDNFVMPHGDNPLTHQLPAGLRIWVERIADWYPLRLIGKNTALQIMDWSRSVRPGKQSSVLSFDERDGVRPSRVAVLGIPERLWQSVEAKDFNRLLADTLHWLARRPDAYLASWPQAHAAGVMLAIDAPDPVQATDFAYSALAESLGGKASYFLLSQYLLDLPPEVLDNMRRGSHEIAFMGDIFEEFKDETAKKQRSRLLVMSREFKAVGFPVTSTSGFHAPMESFDNATHQALSDVGFAYHVTDSGVTEDLMPVTLKTEKGQSLLLYPRALNSIGTLLDEGLSIEAAGQNYARALRVHVDMGGLVIIPVAQNGLVTVDQWRQILSPVFSGSRKPWLASGGEIAAWWRERGRVSSWLDDTVSPALLRVEIRGEGPLVQAVSVVLNQSSAASPVRLLQDNADEKAFQPTLQAVDRWRQRISLQGAEPGVYHWYLQPTASLPLTPIKH